MGLFSKRSRPKRQTRRALRRAHTKALKAQAEAERKFANKAAKKAERAARKTRKKVGSGPSVTDRASSGLAAAASTVSSAASSAGLPTDAASAGKSARTESKKAAKQAKKAAEEARKAAERKQLTPAKARRYIGVARVVVPVVSPLLYRGATQLRGLIDERRARSIGVDVGTLAEFSGHGAKLSARIAGIESTLEELHHRDVGAAGTAAAAEASRDKDFEQATTARLTELSTAVHAAERMPTARRRAAHNAVATELDRIDAELLRRLGVR